MNKTNITSEGKNNITSNKGFENTFCKLKLKNSTIKIGKNSQNDIRIIIIKQDDIVLTRDILVILYVKIINNTIDIIV